MYNTKFWREKILANLVNHKMLDDIFLSSFQKINDQKVFGTCELNGMDGIIKVFTSAHKQPLADPNGTLGAKLLYLEISSANMDGDGCDSDGDECNGDLREGAFGLAEPLGIISCALDACWPRH